MSCNSKNTLGNTASRFFNYCITNVKLSDWLIILISIRIQNFIWIFISVYMYFDYWSLAYLCFFLQVPSPLFFPFEILLWSNTTLMVITHICVIFSRRKMSNMFTFASVGHSKFVKMHGDASHFYPSTLIFYTRHRVNITIYRTVYLHTYMCKRKCLLWQY
jgi:hypothetical protein